MYWTGMLTSNPRVAWIDSAKGFAIALVVLGHLLRGLIASGLLPASEWTRLADDWIYAFHMPLFFFISGLLLQRTIRPPLSFFCDKICTIAYPYLLWSVATIALKSFFKSEVNHPLSFSDLLGIATHPVDQFWFLYALFVAFIVVDVILELHVPSWAVFLTALSLSPGLVFGHFGPEIVADIRRALLFVSLGAVVCSSGLLYDPSRRSAPWLLAEASAGFALLTLAVYCWTTKTPVELLVLATVGIFSSICLSRAIQGVAVGRILRFFGERSLEIYVMHTMFSAATRIALIRFGVCNLPAHLVLGMFAGLGLPLACSEICRWYGVTWPFVAPWREKCKSAKSSIQETESAGLDSMC
jgi:fucose 4-O-acetylase-like acetyltransferase